MKLRNLLLACAVTAATASAQPTVSTDFWDVSQGSVVTAASDIMPWAGTPDGMFGYGGQDNNDGWTWTYFTDGQPPDYVHFIEWETPADVTLGEVRLFGFGDDIYNYGREIGSFTLKAKSPGSDVYDITVLTFTPTHPYLFVDSTSALFLDEVITPITARYFRAEFTEYDAGFGWNGPRIVELDGLPAPRPTVNVPSTSTDVWDVAQGTVVTATSGLHPGAGTATGMFGQNGQTLFDAAALTYFADGQPDGFVHFIEWQTPTNVSVSEVRLYAYGDPTFNTGREFSEMTIKAKSLGSSTYDLTLLTFTPTHPYEILDPNSFMILDQMISPVTASEFRAEFVQYTAGYGWDGPRIVELDAIGVIAPPPSDPPPSDPPPSDPPPSDPPPSDPPPSDPPPSDPPPSDPPPSDPPPSDPPPSDPPPSDPPPSDPPPSDPPPSDPPPSDPPPPTPEPPVITGQPQSVTVNYAMPVALTVQATTTGAVTYQWSKDGAPLAGQTAKTLWIPTLTASEAGTYTVSVTDEVGTVVSSIATVALDLVNILPSAFDLWDTHVGSTVTAITPYLNAPNGMFGDGANSDDSGVTSFVDAAIGSQHIVEWSMPNAAVVSAIRLFARDDSGHDFGSVTIKAKSPGSASFDINVGTFTPTHPYTFVDANTYAILDADIAPINAAAFRAEFTQSSAGGPRVIELDAFTSRPLVMPAVVVNPFSQAIPKGGGTVLSVVARGGNLRYQWKLDGKIIRGAMSDTLTVTNAKPFDAGIYTVVISNELGSTESSPAMLQIINKPQKGKAVVR